MTTVIVIGGGLAGLTAAIACAEAGAKVTLHEAHSTLGGRARSTTAPYVANDGTHAFYEGAPWQWLVARNLVQPAERLGIRQMARVRIRHQGQLRRTPPVSFAAMISLGRRAQAPVDLDFRSWASSRFGETACKAAEGMVGPAIYDADPGRLSAAFVFERLLRVTTPRFPPVTRYPRGGWGAVIDRMEHAARKRGVQIETSSRISALPETGPVIVATSLDAARSLFDNEALRWEGGRAALLDVGLRHSVADPFAIFDFDEGAMIECFTSQDPTLAPAGHDLLQAEIPLHSGESKADGLDRLEAVFDLAFADWRQRLTWRRDQSATNRTGALDLPGQTWRDRPAIDQGEGRYLVGDAAAAPGLLAEVSINSALKASTLTLQH
ncbi:Protoporphyrinogen oxidase [Mycobacteroides abscessus subsp. bolletii]|nr:Protoporphyrinogen oxidase [Mycobacteroides abscessus subsp. bolletii]SKP94370.1 Protoporphyrinogen oxidase [Mycobacteroides abscessus subsp. bolletii]SKQ21468.1 Protoporphyrinogen oxidase [Mycobacteroides abscessus subsp. bolletii]SKQ28521.1 Protoporphyrinogen oxidase [Mycobacteroides abscessus subsp. bolletii]